MPINPQSTYDQTYYTDGGDVGGYDNYRKVTLHEDLGVFAQQLIDNMNAAGQSIIGKKVLDVGCAYGFVIEELVNRGIDCYGIDWSSWAVSQADPAIASRIVQGDASLAATWDAIHTVAGLSPNGPNSTWDLVLDLDCIVCMTDAQATDYLTEAKARSKYIIHYIEAPRSGHNQWYNYKTTAEWKTFAGNDPKEKWYTRVDWIEF